MNSFGLSLLLSLLDEQWEKERDECRTDLLKIYELDLLLLSSPVEDRKEE
jgi:hypothetical protein